MDLAESDRERTKEDTAFWFDVLRRGLKIYDPHFVGFWNAKKRYKMFYSDIQHAINQCESHYIAEKLDRRI